ncbi:hypothetical protein [Actinomadura formosensis]|uniref:hypothetical protein n=1 Tax=Actinomadura formosensis TaxID=60706 RepID=UPI003D92BC62
MNGAEVMRAGLDGMRADVAGAPVCLVDQGRGEPCMAEATVVLEAGCVHEHVFTERMCEPCAASVEAGKATCFSCEESDGHACTLMGRRRP